MRERGGNNCFLNKGTLKGQRERHLCTYDLFKVHNIQYVEFYCIEETSIVYLNSKLSYVRYRAKVSEVKQKQNKLGKTNRVYHESAPKRPEQTNLTTWTNKLKR